MAIEKKMMRSSTNKMIAGVAGGLAEYLDLDPTIVRVGFVALSIFTGGSIGIPLYIILWIVLPEGPSSVAGGGGGGGMG